MPTLFLSFLLVVILLLEAPWGLRADYVLPSTDGLEISAAYV